MNHKFWWVMKYEARGGGAFKRLTNREEANNEAKRRSSANPGTVYVIMEAVATVVTPVTPNPEIKDL